VVFHPLMSQESTPLGMSTQGELENKSST